MPSRSLVRFAPAAFVTALAAVASLAAAGCASEAAPDASAVAADESELRALAEGEIVGSIGFGQTVGPIHYRETPTYRALRLSAAAGDRAKITVTSPGATALWILGGDFTTRAQARAVGRGLPLTVEHTFDAAGTYYLALRDADQEDTDFTVSLERTGSAPPPPPPSSGTIFDADWCTGPAMTKAQILARVPTGATRGRLGSLEIVGRERSCNELTGCLAWQPSTSVPISFAERYGVSLEYTGVGTASLPVPVQRTVDIDLIVASSVDFEPRLSPFAWSEAGTSGWRFNLTAKSSFAWDQADGIYAYANGRSGPLGYAPVVGDGTYPSGTPAQAGSRFPLGGTLRESCTWTKAGGRKYDANRSYLEVEVVLSGRY
jgi:hypothetical protein